MANEKRYNPARPSEGYDRGDLAALKVSSLTPTMVCAELRFDSVEDASIFFARQLDYIKAKSYDKVYPEFTALNHFPITHEVPEGAESMTYYSYDKTGFAAIISNYASDLPRADVKGNPTTVPVKSIGASYGYSVQEMRASRMAGKSLDVRKANAARYACDRTVNMIAFAGDPKHKMQGMLSTDNNIPLYTLSTTEDGKTSWKHINTFRRYAGCNVTFGGYTLAGEWIDVIRFRDWLKAEMQINVFNALKTNRKVPYTDAGIGLIEGKMEETLLKGQTIGGIAGNEYDEENLIPGFTVTVPRATSLTEAERKSRKLPGCRFTARLAGAIHATEIEGYLSF